jgi:hypothetical protein
VPNRITKSHSSSLPRRLREKEWSCFDLDQKNASLSCKSNKTEIDETRKLCLDSPIECGFFFIH